MSNHTSPLPAASERTPWEERIGHVVVGRYSGTEGIERMEAAFGLSYAVAIRERWQDQYYAGPIELWELQRAGHFRQVAWPQPKEA